MTTKYKTRAFVFKKNDKSEADRNFSVFTEDYGRLEILGRAIRKINSKLRAGIDMFYFSEIEFIEGKNNKTLTDATKIKIFDNISKNFKKIEIAYRIADTLDNFLKGQEKDHMLFGLLNELFEKLDSQQLTINNQQLIYYYFIWNFLSLQGYGSEVYNCASCQEKLNPYSIYFSNKEGGVICKKCLDKDKNAQKINSDIVKTLRIIIKKDWDTLLRLKIEQSSQQLLGKISESALTAFCPT